jgi:hypothetical protein
MSQYNNIGIDNTLDKESAITTGWISIGGLWAFGGLLITMKKADM